MPKFDRKYHAEIPSHKGIPQNVLTDRAAKETVTCLLLSNIPLNSSDFLIVPKTLLSHQWKNNWISLPTANKLPYIKKNTHLWLTSNRSSRMKKVALCHLQIRPYTMYSFLLILTSLVESLFPHVTPFGSYHCLSRPF